MARQGDTSAWLSTGTLPDASKLPGLIEHAADVSVFLDADLIIKAITVNPAAASLGCLDHWAGRPFSQFLADESKLKFDSRMETLRADTSGLPIRVELNHVDNATWDFPVTYSMHKLEEGGFILLGRDMRAVAELQRSLVNEQLARERDYQKLRAEEAYFRVVLDTSETAMVLVDPKQGRIRDLNRPAAALLGTVAQSLNGAVFSQCFESRRREDLPEVLQSAAASEDTRGVDVVCRRNGRSLQLFPQYFRAASDLVMLCRIVEASDGAEDGDATWFLGELFANSTDAIVLTDAKGLIREANEAFLVMADAAQLRNVRNQSFADLLSRGAIDFKLICEAADQGTRLRSYATQIVSPIGTRTSVDLSAARLREGNGGAGYGMILRDVTRREAMDVGRRDAFESDGGALVISEDAMKHMMDLVGTASLKELVSATSDVVEKMCIETALQLTSNNRVAAAEMLGLSRQSLYVKLRKHGVIDDSDSS